MLGVGDIKKEKLVGMDVVRLAGGRAGMRGSGLDGDIVKYEISAFGFEIQLCACFF